jgi:tetratricopeptide (TPR) repeat protein
MVFIRVVRKDARNYTKDFGITIEVYTPHSQSRFQFVLEEPELRAYMLMELGVEAISAGDMLDKRNLQRLVASRLIIHKPSSKFGSQQVIFSKHALGQRGEKTVTRAKRIGNEFFVAKIFETGEDLAVQLYHRLTSRIFTCVMTVHEMRNWITEEYKIACRDDELREKTPPVLRPENKKDYHTWILDHLAIDTRRGQFKLLFSCQLLKSQKMQMIVKIQAAMRRALVRPIIVRLLDQFMLKVKVAPTDPNVYYVNRRTGASSWEKPKLLGQLDLPTEPVRKWVQLTYDNGGVSTTHYVNPFTGRYTHLTPQQAARIIQALVRNFLLLPISMSLEQFLKAGHIFKGAESQYTANPTRLAAVINYAMVSHTITLEEDLARRLYGEAVELSEANPLVTRAYAFFMLGTCEAPMVLNRDRAHLLLGDARRKDEDHSKFQTAYYLFKFACLRRPKDFRTLLNLALVQCLLFDQNHNAEKLLRRALALAPFEERVIEIWKYLKDRFPDRQLQYNPQSRVTRINTTKGDKSKRRVVHGRPVAEDSSWAGWCFVEEDKYSVSKTHKGVSYWYNPADGTESLVPPDLETQWAVRRGRSQYTGEVNGMEQYYDPLTAEYFQYHALTETYS